MRKNITFLIFNWAEILQALKTVRESLQNSLNFVSVFTSTTESNAEENLTSYKSYLWII